MQPVPYTATLRKTIAMRFGITVRSNRQRLGITQSALAEALDVDTVTVRRWEMGIRTPTLTNIGRLEVALGSLTTGWLQEMCLSKSSCQSSQRSLDEPRMARKV